MLSRSATLLLLPILLALAAGPAEASAYRFDAGHTVARFRCGPFGFGPDAGRVTGAHGALVFDPGHPADSQVEVSLDMTTLHTDWSALDGQLRGPDFLDVGRYPTATFRSRRVEVTGDGTARVTGDMTLHGVTREVTMLVAVRPAPNGAANLTLSASARIRRSDFGVDRREPFLGDTIELRIEAETQPES